MQLSAVLAVATASFFAAVVGAVFTDHFILRHVLGGEKLLLEVAQKFVDHHAWEGDQHLQRDVYENVRSVFTAIAFDDAVAVVMLVSAMVILVTSTASLVCVTHYPSIG